MPYVWFFYLCQKNTIYAGVQKLNIYVWDKYNPHMTKEYDLLCIFFSKC